MVLMPSVALRALCLFVASEFGGCRIQALAAHGGASPPTKTDEAPVTAPDEGFLSATLGREALSPMCSNVSGAVGSPCSDECFELCAPVVDYKGVHMGCCYQGACGTEAQCEGFYKEHEGDEASQTWYSLVWLLAVASLLAGCVFCGVINSFFWAFLHRNCNERYGGGGSRKFLDDGGEGSSGEDGDSERANLNSR